MKIAIIGTGGVGGYFGGRLAKAGNDVTFLARGAHLLAMQEKGIMVNSVAGDFKLDKVQATDKIEEIGKVDLVILCQKAWQVKEIAPKLSSLLNENTAVLTLQNGVTIVDELKEFIPAKNIVPGLCFIISKIEAPGVFTHFGVEEPTIIFGEEDNVVSERIKAIQTVFEQATIKSYISRDIQADLWRKFISICVSGLMAVAKVTYGGVVAHPSTKQLLRELFTEMYNLSQKMGVNLPEDIIEKNIDRIDTFPYDSTTSLVRDVWAGKPSEIEYQNGAVVRLAERYGVDVPVNRFIYYCILPMEKKARK